MGKNNKAENIRKEIGEKLDLPLSNSTSSSKNKDYNYIPPSRFYTEKEYLAQEMAEQLNDDHSLGFYRKVADIVPGNLIFQALSEVKDAFLTGRVKKSKAALFNTVIWNKAKEYNINLGINKTLN